jgi:antitoxin HigA-1
MARNEFAPITPGEMLKDEFLAEYGLSQNRLARAIGISPNRIAEIVNNRRRIKADTALRLSLYFGNSAEFWLNLLRSQEGTSKSKTRRGKPHQSTASCLILATECRTGIRQARACVRANCARAPASAPPAPQSAASRLADRSGVKACRPSSSAAMAMKTTPTTNGWAQAKQTSSVIPKYPRKWSICQSSSVRGAHLAGPRAAITSRTMMARCKLCTRPKTTFCICAHGNVSL